MMANKIAETGLPADVVNAIEAHLTKAECKHPLFAMQIVPVRLCNPDTIKLLLDEARKNREDSKSVYDVLTEEFFEIFEAIEKKDFYSARTEIYDAIAVLLRLDKVLQEKQRNEDFQRNDIPFCNNS